MPSSQQHVYENNQMMPRMSTAARCALCFLLAFGSCRPVSQRQVSGRVLALEGEAEGRIDGTTVRLTKGTRIQPGEKIASARSGRLDLMLLPGILVELSGGTEIEIEQLRVSKDGDESIQAMKAREARIRLVQGTLYLSVGHTQARSRLIIETAGGRLSAGSNRTSKIKVAGKTTRVMCVQGKATFESTEGVSTKIAAGYFVEWPGPAEPRAAAEAGTEAQAEVTEILGAEKRLRRLEKSMSTPLRGDTGLNVL